MKIWRLPTDLESNLTEADAVVGPFDKSVETVACHPNSSHLLAAGSLYCVKVFDVNKPKSEKFGEKSGG